MLNKRGLTIFVPSNNLMFQSTDNNLFHNMIDQTIDQNLTINSSLNNNSLNNNSLVINNQIDNAQQTVDQQLIDQNNNNIFNLDSNLDSNLNDESDTDSSILILDDSNESIQIISNQSDPESVEELISLENDDKINNASNNYEVSINAQIVGKLSIEYFCLCDN